MKIFNLTSKTTKFYLLMGLLMAFTSTEMRSMEQALRMRPQASPKTLFPVVSIATNDGKTVTIAQWKVDEMKTLLVLLEHQKGKNSPKNPINASMISSQELELLSLALSKASELGNEFELFWDNLVEEDKKNGLWKEGQPLCFSQTMLVNAAQKVEASGLSALCLSYFLDINVQQKLLLPQFINPVISCLNKISLEKKKIFLNDRNISCVTFSPIDNLTFVSGESGGRSRVVLGNISSNNKVSTTSLMPQTLLESTSSLVFSPDGRKIVVNGKFFLDITDLKNIEKSMPFEDLGVRVSRVAFNPLNNTEIISTGGSFFTVSNPIIWDISDPQNIQKKIELPGTADFILKWSPDGTKIVAGDPDKWSNLILWDISDRSTITTQPLTGSASLNDAIFSPDGKRMVSCYEGNKDNLILWDISNLNAISREPLVGHPDSVKAIAFSPDGTTLISGGKGRENNLIIWDLTNPKNISKQVLKGLSDKENSIESINSIAFSPDGNRVALGCNGYPHTLIMWQLLLPHQIKTIEDCNVAQARFMWQLCLRCANNLPLTLDQGSLDCTMFMSLSNNIQELLKNFLGVTCTSKKTFGTFRTLPFSAEKKTSLLGNSPSEKQSPAPAKVTAPAQVQQRKSEENQLLEQQKEGIRRYLRDPGYRTADNIAKLRKIYTEWAPEYKEAFNEVMKEMGLE